jgi:NRPS condensation-like uncharacterized protein
MDYLNKKLGLLENLFEILHDLGAMIDVNVAQIEGSITPNIIQQALYLVQKRHPMLQVHIVELADGFYFQSEGTPEITLRVIDKQHENQWIEIAQDELHQKFPRGTSPLCRVTFLRSSTSNGITEIIATFHHAITDGMSCMRFIDDLLSYCQQIAAGERISEVVTMQALPPLEDMLHPSPASKNNVEENQEKPDQKIPQPKLIIESEAPLSARRTCLVPRILSKEMTLMLINRCKQEETTVHGALCAAMLFGAAKLADTDIPIHLSCNSNVNLRKYCEPEVKDDYIGCLVSALEESHTWENNTNFWDLARECKSKISCSISLGVPINRIHSDNLRQVEKQLLIYMSQHEMGRRHTISVSNLGRVNLLDDYGSFKLKELYFATGQHVVGACFWLGVVTFHEQLFCTFAHVIPVVSAKTTQLFTDSVMATMQKACISQFLTLSMLDEGANKNSSES